MNQNISSFWLNLMDFNRFEKLSNAECVEKYAVDYVTDCKMVVLLISNFTHLEDELLWAEP